MPVAKYFAGIAAAQQRQQDRAAGGLEPFDFAVLADKGRFAALKGRLTRALLPRVYAFSRRFKPLLPLAGLLHVTREAQVREILLRNRDFITPFGPEMAELGQGATFLLGLEGEEHDRLHTILRKVIRREDAARIGALSRQFTVALLDNSPGEIDVIADLIKRVPAEVCLRYFGLECDAVDRFGDWTMALSAFLFGDPYGASEVRQLAMNARQRLDAVIDDALRRAKRRAAEGSLQADQARTLVERLVLVQRDEPLEDREIKAILMGLATGFIPTNTLAASNMLQELLARPDAWQLATTAALNGDLETMRAVVLEAGRLNPALAPGQWRYCPQDTVLRVDGKDHAIKAGTTLLVSTFSALRDPRAWDQPLRFRLDRKHADGTAQEPDLVFGVGPHWCLGKYLAIEQISALFVELLARPGLKPAPGKAGRLQRVGPFPRNMTMRYASPASEQNLFIVLAPVAPGVQKAAVDADLIPLGNPAGPALRAGMDATGLVHFCSLTCIETDGGIKLSFELSVDGPVEQALRRITECAGDLLRPAFAHCGLREDEDLARFLQRHVVKLHGKPWGATGLNYNGLAEFPVQRVERQARFADFAGRVLREYVATETARGSHPTLAMAHLRRVLRGDDQLRAEATPAQLDLIAEAERDGWDAFHLQTQATRLKLARYKPVSNMAAFAGFLKSADGRMVLGPLLALYALWGWLLLPRGGARWTVWLGHFGVVAPAAALLSAAAIVGAYLFLLRRAEQREVPDPSHAPIERLRQIAAQENPPGYAQNHILAMGKLKTGWLRAFTHAFALWGIRVLIVHAFRPGFVINMGTIHYARWWRIPGTGQVAFYSNFDGSWESYLEDFITRARQGQTAAWSNWQGFPRTKWLIDEGARDGDAFKRWVRTQQQLVPCWYARFPQLTSDQIRANALIHSGLGLARNAVECEEWLRCFGSMPRVANRIESDEVQALVFRGMRALRHSACLTLRLPGPGEAVGEWLCWLRGKAMRPVASFGAEAIAALVDAGVLRSVPRPAGRPAEYALASDLTVSFGDRPDPGRHGRAVFLALSAAGLARFDAPNCAPGALLDGMPGAFRMGMAARGKINGDRGVDDPARWRWHDAPDGAEAALLLYAGSPEELEQLIQLHRQLLENHGGRVLGCTRCAPAWDDEERADFEHFGYRDGISQPVIRGTGRAARGYPERDLIEPGEFILGYANAQGYLPPSPVLPAEADVRTTLPLHDPATLSRFPDFGAESETRDFGRNGSYLVLREIRQDVERFDAFVSRAVADLACGGLADLDQLVGQQPDADWVKAKLMGRWPDGRPLVGHRIKRSGTPPDPDETRENDFSFGADDPQGLACPFGAHIRRTNPRDSKQPGDPDEQVITNRHRILRRGRTYRRADTGERGLLFACLCADIERQFEFVQQFWANAPAFHGLNNEPDPIVGADPVHPLSGAACPRVFTVPTAAGPVQIGGLERFVQIMAGGYFFLPSRSALTWLSDVALISASTQGAADHG